MSKLLKEIRAGWKKRLEVLGLNGSEFCKKTGIPYSGYAQLRNPTIKLLDRIESAIVELEKAKTEKEKMQLNPYYEGDQIVSFGIIIDDRDNLIWGIELLLNVAFVCHQNNFYPERLRISEGNFTVDVNYYSKKEKVQDIINKISNYLKNNSSYFCPISYSSNIELTNLTAE